MQNNNTHMSDDKNMDPELKRVAKEGGTEAPFTGKYWNEHGDGMYHCAVCNTALFASDKKFDSGTGWPSFTDPAVAENVGTREDGTMGMHRTEVFCKKCNAHLGHVFNDGPAEAGGKRYCINSVCLELQKKEEGK